jgi:hypothetical protein
MAGCTGVTLAHVATGFIGNYNVAYFNMRERLSWNAYYTQVVVVRLVQIGLIEQIPQCLSEYFCLGTFKDAFAVTGPLHCMIPLQPCLFTRCTGLVCEHYSGMGAACAINLGFE